jgi:hypothetical protein
VPCCASSLRRRCHATQSSRGTSAVLVDTISVLKIEWCSYQLLLPSGLAHGFEITFAWVLGLTILSFVPALLLPGRDHQAR